MNQEKIGNLIKQIRKENQLTQQQFASKYGVTYQAVSKWENGKNIPDIALLRQMSKDFHIDIQDILDGEMTTKKKKKYKYVWIVIVVFCFLFVGGFLLLKHEDTFEFKTLSSSCSAFTISGNMAYNKNKSSISISNIVYCGGEDSNLYKQIDCVLYENDFDKNVKIGEQTITKQESISLEEFLKDVSFYIEDYERSCKVYHENSLFLEINAIDTHDHMITYKVPITIEGNC